jgi:hypothetical protein
MEAYRKEFQKVERFILNKKSNRDGGDLYNLFDALSDKCPTVL